MSSIRHCHSEGVECIESIQDESWKCWDAVGAWAMDHPEVRVWTAFLSYSMDDEMWSLTAYVTGLDPVPAPALLPVGE